MKQQYLHHIMIDHNMQTIELCIFYDLSIYELPELTGQSLILLCQVRCQLACLNIFSFRWIQMDLMWYKLLASDLSFNEPRIALIALESCPVERIILKEKETKLTSIGQSYHLPPPPPHHHQHHHQQQQHHHLPQSSSISSQFKQPLLLLLFSFLKAQYHPPLLIVIISIVIITIISISSSIIIITNDTLKQQRQQPAQAASAVVPLQLPQVASAAGDAPAPKPATKSYYHHIGI